MKTIIFNGSPRKNGDTSFLVDKLKNSLCGEVYVYNSYLTAVQPCSDCRYCWKTVGCCIDDEMQEIYQCIKDADCIIIASPLHFSELTGSLLNLLSRLQTFYTSKRFLKVQQVEKPKIGALILCGGGDGEPKKAEGTANTLFKFMNTTHSKTIYSLNTDNVQSEQDDEAINQIIELAESLNSNYNINNNNKLNRNLRGENNDR